MKTNLTEDPNPFDGPILAGSIEDDRDELAARLQRYHGALYDLLEIVEEIPAPRPSHVREAIEQARKVLSEGPGAHPDRWRGGIDR